MKIQNLGKWVRLHVDGPFWRDRFARMRADGSLEFGVAKRGYTARRVSVVDQPPLWWRLVGR